MKKTTYICDKCKREIEDNPIKIFAEEVDREDGYFASMALYPEWQNLDFCKSCADYVVNLIKEMCTKGAPATNDSQSSPEPPPNEGPGEGSQKENRSWQSDGSA